MTRSDHYLQITSNWNKTKNNSLFKLARAVTIERLKIYFVIRYFLKKKTKNNSLFKLARAVTIERLNIYFCIYLDTLIFFYK